MGGVTFRDKATPARVLDDGSAHFHMSAFKMSLEVALKQDEVLIIAREGEVL